MMSATSSKSTVAGSFSFDGDPGTTEKRAHLDHYYYFVKTHLVSKQSGTLGLFRKGSNSLPVAPVRDNIYNATALWALSVAYRSFGNDNGRGYEMQQSAVKCMRAILICYMQNAQKVERFKETQSKDDSLPAYFHYETGEAILDPESDGHLQIDAVALYLLQLAQMTSAGLQVIFSMDEVNFIQNLIYYIERSYRTPDYGMWQRGRKDDPSRMELHASSIGLVKAALESMNGLNLYGAQGTSLTTAHVDPDAHHRNSSTLQSLLPRESNSKETDAALLPVVGFPAYAIDKELAGTTRDRVVSKLKGVCGLKRFSRDGQYTVLEQSSKGKDGPTELRVYDGVECEWPIFLCFLAIEKYGNGDEAGARECLHQLDRLLDKDGVVPKCYVVEKQFVESERIAPAAQHRQALHEEEPWLWAQSLYIITCLLISGVIDLASIDPLGRHLSSSLAGYRPLKQDGLRIAEKNTVVQISLVAESAHLQARLATFGIASQTVQQVEPIIVLPQASLVDAFKDLGVNPRLSLSGRPSRPKGALGTSMVYRIKGDVVVFTPIFLDQTDFYMSADLSLLIDVIKDNLKFIYDNWNKPKRPLMVLLLRSNYAASGAHVSEMIEMMAAFKQGVWEGVPVKLGRLQQFIATSFVEQLDFVKQDVRTLAPAPSSVRQQVLNRTSRVSLFNPVRAGTVTPPPPPADLGEDIDFSKLYSSEEIMDHFNESVLVVTKMMLLSRLFLCHGPGFRTPLGTVVEVVKGLYDKALTDQDWYSIRIGASLLGKTVDSLAPSITLMVAVNRQVCIGVVGHEERVISEPLPPAEIQTVLFNSVRPHQVADASLQQELVIFLGGFVSGQPSLFEGMQRIHLGWLTQAMSDELKMPGSEYHVNSIYQLSPSQIKQLLLEVLSSRYQNPERTWLQQRRREGSLNRVPSHFYEKVLQVLLQSQGGLSLYKYHLPQEPLVQDNKPQDKSFILCVEELLSQSPCPEYRQLIVELLGVLASLFERNSEVNATETLSLDKLLMKAVSMYATDNDLDTESMKNEALTLAFAQSYPHGNQGTTAYLLRASVDHLLHSDVDFDANKCIIS
ncbi:phosphorylase b kinase regulatory subunit beta-like [Sycon ciliatum]|uniref:phosphorylase b kinase regulatory subunit beta-like n=1 Tax=Sycon ciliatum TaxID=27933 RepID=UPI0020AE4A51|eukprot:scpid26540/ scgid28211/ Phosphorylase b kinase regulatory subunit beta